MVIILSNPLHFQSSPKFEGPESDGPPTRRGEGGQRLDLPTRFRAYTPNMETPYPTPLFFQRKSWFLYLSGRRVEPLARAPHAGLTLAEPRVGPRLLEAFRKPLGRLSRSGGTARTLAALPASARPAVWASRIRAAREPRRTDRRRSPESPDGSGRGDKAESERTSKPAGPRRVPPAAGFSFAPRACFQIASSSRGRVSFRRPEVGPLPRRAHVTAGRNRARPGGGSRLARHAPLRGAAPEAGGKGGRSSV